MQKTFDTSPSQLAVLVANGQVLTNEAIADVLISGVDVKPQALILMAGTMKNKDQALNLQRRFACLPKAQQLDGLMGAANVYATQSAMTHVDFANFEKFAKIVDTDKTPVFAQSDTSVEKAAVIRNLNTAAKLIQMPTSAAGLQALNMSRKLIKRDLPKPQFKIKLPSFMQMVKAVRPAFSFGRTPELTA